MDQRAPLQAENNIESTDDGPEGPFFSSAYEPIADIDKLASKLAAADSGIAIVYTVLQAILPSEYFHDRRFRDVLTAYLQEAEHYYTHTLWPDYPRKTADYDAVIALYDTTEPYDGCTLLATMDQVARTQRVPTDTMIEADRIARIMIWNEVTPADAPGQP